MAADISSGEMTFALFLRPPATATHDAVAIVDVEELIGAKGFTWIGKLPIGR